MVEVAPQLGDRTVRVDARDKVLGRAAFPSDAPAIGTAYAVLLTSAIARGRIEKIDASRARGVPGYLLLLTHENTQGEMQPPRAFIGESTTTVETPDVMHDGQIVGLLVAETLEAAREAAAAVRIDYTSTAATHGFDAPGATVHAVHELDPKHEDPTKGRIEEGLRSARATVDAHYSTPTQHHNAMELFTTTCWWSGDRLTVHEPSQFVLNRGDLAASLKMPVDNIRVVSRYCGGGFGGKTSGTPRTVLTAIAARRLKRPVKLVVGRDQGFTINTYRAETRHHVRLGAGKDGRLTALAHEGWEVSSRPSPYTVSGTEATARMYACPHIWTRVSVVQADRNTPGFMRCPAELPYMFALESAMDELSYAVKLDPVELRRRNDTQADPIDGRPFSSRSLVQCFDRGAEMFGWKGRELRPRSMQDGDWLVGWGCATACYPANNGASAARVTLDGHGTARVQVAFHEIGNGAYTVIAQTAAVMLGIPVARVSVELGDTLLPVGNIAAGSNGTATTCNAVAAACTEIRQKLALGAHAGEPLLQAIARLGGMVEATSSYSAKGVPPGALQRLKVGVPALSGGAHAKDHIMFAFGAQFVEVRVHRLTGEVRAPRATGVFAAGKIVNKRTAHSQLMGGMIWGIGAALLEETIVDPHSARYLNDNLADYLIATNADVGEVLVDTIDEHDPHVNPLGIKGVGELGCTGMNAAVANGVFHATGVRLRDLPIRAQHLAAVV